MVIKLSPPPQFMVMSFTNKQLAMYDDEESLQTRDPIMTFQFSQIYAVRTPNPGDHELLRVKQSDLKKILMVRGRPSGGRGLTSLSLFCSCPTSRTLALLLVLLTPHRQSTSSPTRGSGDHTPQLV